MPPTTIHSAPALDSFTTLADHQSQTPTSFYGAKPVLHYHGTDVRVLIAQDHLSKLPIFTNPEGAHTGTNTEPPTGDDAGLAPNVTESMDTFITSECVLIP
jgi:chloride channel, nucleotide-sensitive, 1A